MQWGSRAVGQYDFLLEAHAGRGRGRERRVWLERGEGGFLSVRATRWPRWQLRTSARRPREPQPPSPSALPFSPESRRAVPAAPVTGRPRAVALSPLPPPPRARPSRSRSLRRRELSGPAPCRPPASPPSTRVASEPRPPSLSSRARRGVAGTGPGPAGTRRRPPAARARTRSCGAGTERAPAAGAPRRALGGRERPLHRQARAAGAPRSSRWGQSPGESAAAAAPEGLRALCSAEPERGGPERPACDAGRGCLAEGEMRAASAGPCVRHWVGGPRGRTLSRFLPPRSLCLFLTNAVHETQSPCTIPCRPCVSKRWHTPIHSVALFGEPYAPPGACSCELRWIYM